MGDWQPYGKLKPYIQFNLFLLLWLPAAGYLIYGVTIGDFWPDLGTEAEAAFSILVMIGVIAFPFYHILAGFYMN